MVSVRIVEIPEMKAAYSGPLTDEKSFARFVGWFSNFHASLKYELFPRDFMWYNERSGVREWFYALPRACDGDKIDGFDIVDLPAGLFAVASCLNADIDNAADWLKTREEIMEWVNDSKLFELYQNGDGIPERYPMFHIVSPGCLMQDGVSIENLYVPIRKKA